MIPLSRNITSLKLALQDLETALQYPPGEKWATDRVLGLFPAVISDFAKVLSESLAIPPVSPLPLEELFATALRRGWIIGAPEQWSLLLQIYENNMCPRDLPDSRATVRHIRTCSSLLWQSFDTLSHQPRPLPATVFIKPAIEISHAV